MTFRESLDRHETAATKLALGGLERGGERVG
jgi:hypothetical protein